MFAKVLAILVVLVCDPTGKDICHVVGKYRRDFSEVARRWSGILWELVAPMLFAPDRAIL